MKIFYLALRSIRCKWFSFLIIFLQLSICFAILIYTVCALFLQFDVIYTANGAHCGYLRLSPDLIFTENYQQEYRRIENRADFLKMYLEFLKNNGLTQEQGVTQEQYDFIYREYSRREDNEFDKYHYMGKYQYSDLYDRLSKTDYVVDIISNYGTFFPYEDKDAERFYDVTAVLIDEKLYNSVKLRTKRGVNLHDYPLKDNYFYAIMYPNVSVNGEVDERPYGVGDVLSDKVYNRKKQCYETFYYEIVDELEDPAYVLPELSYSGSSNNYTKLEKAFLSTQSMSYNGALVALKPDYFDRMNYYTYFNERFTLIKPSSDLSEKEYSDLLNIIRECGFNIINLDNAENNTINGIRIFIRENCLILTASVFMVVFSIISISVLSGSQVRREYGVYRLCGADLHKIKVLSAVKWALIFIPAMALGVVTANIYSKISEMSTHFIAAGTAVSGVLFAVLYIVSFIMSYKSASASYKSADLSEEENYD